LSVLSHLLAAVLVTEVSLLTPTGTLYGTLVVPGAMTKVPVVLIIAASGPTDRDGNSAFVRCDSLKMLADGLARYGIASLRYDKRGIGASFAAGPPEPDLRFEMYVDDAVAWGEKLRADVRFSSVTFAGHSQGALIGTIAAQRLPADKLISISGAGHPAGELILAQLAGQISPELYRSASDIVAALNAGNIVPNPPPALYALFRPSVQPFLISWFRYDPVREIANVKAPVFIVQGTTDTQISIDDALRLASGNPAAKLLIISGMNHVLKDVSLDPDAQDRAYSDPSLPIDNTLVEAIAGFVMPLPKRRAVVVH
jgi:hypothetical protein